MALILIRKHFRRGLRLAISLTVVSGVVVQIVALSPASVDETPENTSQIDPSTLIPKENNILAPGIPVGQVPEYSAQGFNYISTHGSIKDWNIIADRADMYNTEHIVHATTVKAFLYDPDGKSTIVSGQEAKYIMPASPEHRQDVDATKYKDSSATANHPLSNQPRDLEVFGDVKTVFPDGFVVHSDYMRYFPDKKTIFIPDSYIADGWGKDDSGQVLNFTSLGMTYAMGQAEIELHQNVKVVVEKQKEKTTIESDHCEIDRIKKIAHFTMSPERPLESRFVRINQPTLFSKGRRGELAYGDIHAEKSTRLNSIVLYDDVVLKELKKGPLKYATAGQADFVSDKDLVILTKYPQVYQDQDTATGDRIVLHRDTDIVEVEHSNSFSRGQDSP